MRGIRCLMFPGQGSQKAGTINRILDRYPYTRTILQQADQACKIPLSKYLLDQSSEAEHKLKPTEIAQPAILTHSYIVWAILQKELGISLAQDQFATYALGHSLGEFTALCAAQAIEFEDVVRLVRKRGEIMRDVSLKQSIDPAMAALLPCTKDFAELICQDTMRLLQSSHSVGKRSLVVQPANYNTANQTVISGDALAVKRAVEIAKQGLGGNKIKRAVMLNVSAPFHCSLMQDAEVEFDQSIQSINWKRPVIPIISNVTTQPIETVDDIKRALKTHITSPVMFHQSIVALIDQKHVDTFLELGPSPVLGSMAQTIAKDIKNATLDVTSLSSVEQIEDFIGQQSK